MSGFLDAARPFAHCAGCGHPHVLRALDEALGILDLPRHRIVVVTDIGCVGLADPHFPTIHTVHSLHGRSTAIAAGLCLGEPAGDLAPLKPVVLIGDGGATIGLLHLVHAAQMDVDVTVIVHNNLVYGMTGGQHSGFTPEGSRTTTTPQGSPYPAIDLRLVMAGAGCGFFARARAPGPDLASTIAEAIRRPGFACVEALELCPTFAARVGGLTGKDIDALAAGRVKEVDRRPRRAARASVLPDDDPLAHAIPVDPSLGRLSRAVRVVVAGRAGERVQSAASLAAGASAAAGLHATVRTDNPVTQGRGFSLSEIVLSPEPIACASSECADLAIATSPEGFEELHRRGAGTATRWIVDGSLAVPPDVTVERAEYRKRYGPKGAALGALVETAAAEGWWAPAAWTVAFSPLPEAARAEAERTLAAAAVPAV